MTTPFSDTVARYDPLEALFDISGATGVDARTVALVLEGEMDYLGCLGLLDERELDEATLHQVRELRRENSDLVAGSEGEYDLGVAASFVQRNRGIDRETVVQVLRANHRFMDERGFLDEEWGEA